MNANKEINVTILKKVLTEGKIVPLNFVTALIQQFISIVSKKMFICRGRAKYFKKNSTFNYCGRYSRTIS